MKYQSLFSRKNITKCHLLKILPSMLIIKGNRIIVLDVKLLFPPIVSCKLLILCNFDTGRGAMMCKEAVVTI